MVSPQEGQKRNVVFGCQILATSRGSHISLNIKASQALISKFPFFHSNMNRIDQFYFSDLVSSFDPRNVIQFTSPWAAKFEDEVFFSRTIETVGSIIKDDVKLGTLYCTLLLATPGPNLSKASQTNPSLQKVQREMSILIYRYLAHKFGNSHYASNTASALIK